MRRVFGLRTRAASALGAVAIVATTMVVGLPTPAGAAPSLTGTPWRSMTGPTFPVSSELDGVSCPPTGGRFCVAVGQNGESALAEVWKGSWKITPVPSPGTEAILVAVSCTSPTSCMAVGDENQFTSTAGVFADYWNGTSWTLSMNTAVAASLSGVSCAASDCLAVGYNGRTTGVENTSTTFAELWNGSSWTNVSPSLNGGFAGTSCATAAQCLSVGQSVPGGFDSNTTLGALYDNGTWSNEPPVEPATPDNMLNGVSCLTATSVCMAVGVKAGGHPNSYPIADTWNGSTSTWTATTPVNPDGTQTGYGEFRGVSCPTAALCVAVGDNSTGANNGTSLALAEAWNGSKWVKMGTGSLAPLGVLGQWFQPNGVSCESATFCVAVGYKFGLNPVQHAAAASWGNAPL
jgi:hypothetical protein